MRYRNPLKQILLQTRLHWDREETRPAVREVFLKALLCGTPALGAEVYASENEEKIVCHTCKGRGCASCGFRTTLQWQRERWAALPDVRYKGITFTMPDVLWQLFHKNPALARALPALAANTIQSLASARHGLRVGIIAILHTFNGRLDFNSHVHTMVTAGGLQASGSWLSSVYYHQDSLMACWRQAVISLLRAALRAGLLKMEPSADETQTILAEKEKCWWSVKIRSFRSKEHFLRYAGRYLRRPPIAQRRISYIGKQSITFWYIDKRSGRRVEVHCSPENFIDYWAQHIPERHQHAVRNFGLFAPRPVRGTSAAVFVALGQKPRPRPKPVPWAMSIKRTFGWDPLLDSKGERMTWLRRKPPAV